MWILLFNWTEISENMKGVKVRWTEKKEIEEFIVLDDQHFDFSSYSELWENYLDTREKEIEYAVCASETPSVAAMLFLDAIKKYS